MTRFALSIGLATCLLLSTGAAGQSPDAGVRERLYFEKVRRPTSPLVSFAPVVRAVRSSVVNVTAHRDSPSGEVPLRGSGFIINAGGDVVTNAHVVKGAHDIVVKLADGREFAATIRGQDAPTDIALLHCRGATGLPFAELGDSDGLEVGDWVLAIGNPFGFEHSVSHGVVSAKERTLGASTFDEYLQIDALINPGSSGGPLFDMTGAVVGVNSAIVQGGQGIGFAIPSNMLKDLLPNIAANGKVERGFLGVNAHEHRNGTGNAKVVIEDVYRDSPAAVAGLEPGDEIVRVAGRAVGSYGSAMRRISLLGPGALLPLTVRRNGALRDVAVRLAVKPAPDAIDLLDQTAHVPVLGVLVFVRGHEIAVDAGTRQGVLVAAVLPNTPAEAAAVHAGDRIISLNGRGLDGLSDLQSLPPSTPSVRLVVLRGGKSISLDVPLAR